MSWPFCRIAGASCGLPRETASTATMATPSSSTRTIPNDPRSLSHNFIRDLFEDDQGYLWVAAYPGVNKFDPTTERSTRYRHDPNNPNSFSGDSVESITRDSRGYLWFATGIAAWTGLTRRRKRSRTTGMTATANSSGGSGA